MSNNERTTRQKKKTNDNVLLQDIENPLFLHAFLDEHVSGRGENPLVSLQTFLFLLQTNFSSLKKEITLFQGAIEDYETLQAKKNQERKKEEKKGEKEKKKDSIVGMNNADYPCLEQYNASIQKELFDLILKRLQNQKLAFFSVGYHHAKEFENGEKSSEGHAIGLMIETKQKNKVFDIIITNSGDGLELHPRSPYHVDSKLQRVLWKLSSLNQNEMLEITSWFLFCRFFVNWDSNKIQRVKKVGQIYNVLEWFLNRNQNRQYEDDEYYIPKSKDMLNEKDEKDPFFFRLPQKGSSCSYFSIYYGLLYAVRTFVSKAELEFTKEFRNVLIQYLEKALLYYTETESKPKPEQAPDDESKKTRMWLCRLYLEKNLFSSSSSKTTDQVWKTILSFETIFSSQQAFSIQETKVKFQSFLEKQLLVQKIETKTETKTVTQPFSRFSFSSIVEGIQSKEFEKLFQKTANKLEDDIQTEVLQRIFFLPVVSSTAQKIDKDTALSNVLVPFLNFSKNVLQDRYILESLGFFAKKWFFLLLFLKMQKHFDLFVLLPETDKKELEKNFSDTLRVFQFYRFPFHLFSDDQIYEMLCLLTPYMKYIPTTKEKYDWWFEKKRKEETWQDWKNVDYLSLRVLCFIFQKSDSGFTDINMYAPISRTFDILSFLNGFQANSNMAVYFKNYSSVRYYHHSVAFFNPYSETKVLDVYCPETATQYRLDASILHARFLEMDDQSQQMVKFWSFVSSKGDILLYVLFLSCITFPTWEEIKKKTCFTFLETMLRNVTIEEKLQAKKTFDLIELMLQVLRRNQPFLKSSFVTRSYYDNTTVFSYVLEVYKKQLVKELVLKEKPNVKDFDLLPWLARFKYVDSFNSDQITLLPINNLENQKFAQFQGFSLNEKQKIFLSTTHSYEFYQKEYFRAQLEQFPNLTLYITSSPTAEVLFVEPKTTKLFLDPDFTQEVIQLQDSAISFPFLLTNHENETLCFSTQKENKITIRNYVYHPSTQEVVRREEVFLYLTVETSQLKQIFYKDKQIVFGQKDTSVSIPFFISRWKLSKSISWFFLYDSSSQQYSLGFFSKKRNSYDKSWFKGFETMFGSGDIFLPEFQLRERFYEFPLHRFGIDVPERTTDILHLLYFWFLHYCTQHMYDEAVHLSEIIHFSNKPNLPIPYNPPRDSYSCYIENAKVRETKETKKTTFSFFDSRRNLMEKCLTLTPLPSSSSPSEIVGFFEQLFGSPVRSRQWEIVRTILSQWKAAKEIQPLHLLMGQGKSSVIVPLLALFIVLEIQKHAVIVVPNHLLRPTLQHIRRLFQGSLTGHQIVDNTSDELRQKMKEKAFNHIFVLSDDQLKSRFISWVANAHDDIEQIRDSCAFICDEIDTLMNPLTNVLQQPSSPPVLLSHHKNLSRFALLCLTKIQNLLLRMYNNHQNLTTADALQLVQLSEIDKSLEEFKQKYSSSVDLLYGLNQLKHRFAVALLMIYNVQYGWSENKQELKIVPYRGLNKPQNNAVYSDPYLLIWLTLLTTFYKGFRSNCDEEHLYHYLFNRMQISANEEIQRHSISDWMSLFQWKNLSDVKLENIQVDVLKKNYNKFVLEVVLPQTAKYTKAQINVSFIDICTKFTLMKYKCGFSGTFLPYSFTYPKENTDFEFVEPSEDKATTNAIRTVLSNSNILRDDIQWMSVLNEYDILIDACSKFKFFTPLEMVKHLHKSMSPHPRDAFVYFDEFDNRKYLNAKDNSIGDATSFWLEKQHKEGKKLLLYYDQGHIVGSDIPQTGKEKGLITFDHTCAFNSFAQAAFRMRHLTEKKNDSLQTLHVWLEPTRETEVSFSDHEDDKKEEDFTVKLNKKRLSNVDINPTSLKKQKNDFDLLSFLDVQQKQEWENSSRERALQNLKFLKRFKDKYASLTALEDRSLYEWDEHSTDPMVRDVQKQYALNLTTTQSQDLFVLYQNRMFCPPSSSLKYPSSLCTQLVSFSPYLRSSYIHVSTMEILSTTTTEQNQDLLHNVVTSRASNYWSSPFYSYYIRWTKRKYWENETSPEHFLSPYLNNFLKHHNLGYFQSHSTLEIDNATRLHNLFWQKHPFFLLCTSSPYHQTEMIICEEEVVQLLPYLPKGVVIVTKNGFNVKTKQEEKEIKTRKSWPVLQCLTGQLDGLSVVIRDKDMRNAVYDFYLDFDLTYLEIYRIVSHFCSTDQFIIDERFFNAIAFSIHSLEEDAQKVVYKYYSELLKLPLR
jgi:hypothetical protein